MADAHRKIFFGQNTGMILQSPSMREPDLFLTFFMKKEDGTWEKPSEREGKTLKFSIEEIVMILEVLRGGLAQWSIIHRFKDEQTSIVVKWDDKDPEVVWMLVNKKYRKQFNFAQIQILKLLLEHILQEKIAYSTVPQRKEEELTEEPPSTIVKEEIVKKEAKSSTTTQAETTIIEGVIKNSTEKALFIEFTPEHEVWIPKSTLHSDYDVKNEKVQSFEIDTWILKKNNLIKQ